MARPRGKRRGDPIHCLGIGRPWHRMPGGLSLVVMRDPETGAHVLRSMAWGMGVNRRTHVKAETLGAAPLTRGAMQEGRRCLLPLDGYVQQTHRTSDPGRPAATVLPADETLLVLAGLWVGPGPGASPATPPSYAVVTCPANDAVSPLHDRMPVVLGADDWPKWLDGSPAEAMSLLTPCPSTWLSVRPIDKAVDFDPSHPQPGTPAEQMRALGLMPRRSPRGVTGPWTWSA